MTQTVHVNTINVGDRVIISDGDSVTVTATEITGKGYLRIFGRLPGTNYSFMVFNQNCYVEKEIEMTDVQTEGNYSFEQHQANVVALGDGENLHDDLVLTDDDTAATYQARLEAELARRIGDENRRAALWRHTQATRTRNRDNDDCDDCPEVYAGDYTDARIEFGQAWNRERHEREQHADAEAAAKHKAIMATITKIVTETAPRGNVQKRRVWGLLDDMIL